MNADPVEVSILALMLVAVLVLAGALFSISRGRGRSVVNDLPSTPRPVLSLEPRSETEQEYDDRTNRRAF